MSISLKKHPLVETADWRLVDEHGQPVAFEQTVIDFRGDRLTLKGGTPPHKISSTGRIYVTDAGSHGPESSYYPSVCNLKWERK